MSQTQVNEASQLKNQSENRNARDEGSIHPNPKGVKEDESQSLETEKHSSSELSAKTVKQWKVTPDNFDETFAILENAINKLMCINPSDLVCQAHSLVQEVDLLKKSSRRSTTSDTNTRLKLLNRVLDMNIADLYKNWYKAITKAFDQCRSLYSEELTTEEIWYKIKENHKDLYKSMHLYSSALHVWFNGSDIRKSHHTLARMFDSSAAFLLQGLDSGYLFPLQNDVKSASYDVVKTYLSTLFNFCHNLDRGQDMREMGALRIFGKYRDLASEKLVSLKTLAVMCTGLLMTDQSDKTNLSLSDSDVRFMLKLVSGALSYKGYRSVKSGFRADELMRAINHVSSVEDNKVKLIEAGILPIYVKALKTGNKSLQVLAATGIWSLAFDGKSKESIKNEPGCIDLLKDLTKSEDQEIKDAASGAMWQIEGESKHKEHIDKQVQPDVAKHIMISYQWDVKPEVLMVRERLREAGFRVWIDVEQMGGSTLESMAFAVENAAVVVPVLTEKYKLSPACRQEAEYGNFLQKKMVPLRLQPKYRPDGWLGFMLGSTFFYDLTKPATYEEKLVDFINAIGDAGKIKPGEALEPAKYNSIKLKPEAAPVSSNISAPVGSSVNPDKSVISAPGSHGIDVTKLSCYTWTPEEVRKWLTNNSLDAQKDKFDGYDGGLLCELLALQLSCPEVYYSFLREEYKMPLKSVLTLNKAMRTITQT